MNKEFLHMQKLAGIITESEYQAKIKENIQEVTLYATWILDTPEAKKEGIVWSPSISEDNIPSSFSGTSTPNGKYGSKNVILCTNYPWTLVSDTNEIPLEDIKILIVKFKKPLTDVFLDDDFDIDGFGIDEEPDLDYSKKIPLSELVPYGLDTRGEWYGCYVNNISPDEIISKKVGFQNEDMGGGEWSSF
jgi:hypothetical protein